MHMARGRLRIYLGAAPGVGKTYAMLGEGHRRKDRGTIDEAPHASTKCEAEASHDNICAGQPTCSNRRRESAS